MNKPLFKKPVPIYVNNCPECNSDNIAWQSVFDFKYRIICRDCDYHTQWHLKSLEKAVEEWNGTLIKNNS